MTRKTLFTHELDDVCRAWFKGSTPIPPTDKTRSAREVINAALNTAEALVIAPQVTLKVHGENAVLALLAKHYGVKGLEALLKEDALRFVLWNRDVGVWEKISGVYALGAIHLTNPEHADPGASAESGLRKWADWMFPDDVSRLARLAADRTILPREDVASVAIDRVHRAYSGGLLESRGLDGKQPLDNLPQDIRAKLGQIASNIVEASIALDQNYDFYAGGPPWDDLVVCCAKLEAEKGVHETVERVMAIERLPSIQQLILGEAIDLEDVVSIRNRKETEAFRKWLWQRPDPSDAGAVADEYLAAMAPRVDWKDSKWFKSARISAIGILGSAIGTVVGGPVGAAVGAAAGFAASTAVGLVPSLVDGFWIDKFLGDASPRRFANDVIAPALASATARRQRDSKSANAEKRRRRARR